MRENLVGFEVYEREVHMEDILSFFRKKELVTLARSHGLSGYSHLKKEDLIVWIKDRILDEAVLRAYFLCMHDGEIDLLRQVCDFGEVTQDMDPVDFSYLMAGGYAGYTQDLMFGVPSEVIEGFARIDTEDFEQERCRLMQIGNYCHLAMYLYGVAPPMQVVKIFNLYERKKTDWNEVMSVYERIKKYRCDFIYRDVYFVDLMFKDNYIPLLEIQGDVPYYMPTWEQVEQWNCFGYVPDIQDVLVDLHDFMVDKMWVDAERAADICFILQQATRIGCQFDAMEAQLHRMGIQGRTQKQDKVFRELLTALWKNARMIIHRGYTPGGWSWKY